MKIINADAVLAKIDKEREYLVARGQLGAEHILVKYCRDFIEDAPPVEPPKGEWIKGGKDATGQYFQDEFVCNKCFAVVTDKSNFCPNCGAKMDMGGKEDVFTRKEELSKEESEWLIDFITKEVMTLDEAIDHCEKKAQELREAPLKRRMDLVEVVDCEQCAEEHEQLAKWLKELKGYRNEKDI